MALVAILRREGFAQHFDASPLQDGLPEPAEPATSGSRSFYGLDAVSAALDRLHRLATAIRRSSIESQKDKLLTKTSCSEEDTYLQSCIYRLLRDRFPTARTTLLEQLTSALIFHRKRLLYGSRHNKKLASKGQRGKSGGPNHAGILAQQVLMRNLAVVGIPPGVSQTEPLSITEASIPDSQLRRAVLKASRPVASVVSIGSTVFGDHFQYPDAPTFEKHAQFHPCPYCAEPLSTKRLGPERRDFWRAHVIRDLEPYICISDDCRDPLQFFVHFQDWLDHMNSKHTIEWYRTIHMLTWHCDLSHEETQYFDSKARFDMHTREAHANLTSTQIIARIKRSKATGLRQQLTCPLCETVPDRLQAPNIELPPLEDARSVLAQHVGSHIKALSLLSFRLVPLNGVEQVTAVSLGSSDDLSMNLGQTVSGVHSPRRLSDIESELDIPEHPSAYADQHSLPHVNDTVVTTLRSQSEDESLQFRTLLDGLLSNGNLAAQGRAIGHFSCLSLSIGTWRRVAKDDPELLVTYTLSGAHMAYHLNNDSAGYKIEYPFTSIKSIRLSPDGTDTTTDEVLLRTGGLIIEFNRPPQFFMAFQRPGPFSPCGDFTEDQQASKVLIHYLGGLHEVLDGVFARLTSLESFQMRHDSYDLDGDLRTRNVGISRYGFPVFMMERRSGTEIPFSDREMWDFLPGFEHLRYQQSTTSQEQAHVNQDSDGDRTTKAPGYRQGNDSGLAALDVPASPLGGAPAMSSEAMQGNLSFGPDAGWVLGNEAPTRPWGGEEEGPTRQVFASVPADSSGNSEETREREVVPVSIREADSRKSALERARDDYNVQRRKQQYEERRPGTSGGTGRGQVVIVDDDD
ncbi:hypothetical protein LTR98_002087 [Exophiala xenobiotica]|uniref:TRF2/HOY1 PH-like domain-containing protein n=1 Tax=Vermiconidia calcicola TaxID=1690605 RepID=A0AAV9QHX7_9PEZI|nr:hypothetical protein LTR98_002087 [Exophiala xenobiotica]KAK5434013.1 hypothetical protein LTR34_003525 [Exophiala xenobiotica]KAK5541509.1 hypothetical protein LTR23_005831 [Chaetothyriales sp. CCFEE 6169]KAK5542245.1 hypothetical protein LTR25_002130 [Vermiconidia calcicola]